MDQQHNQQTLDEGEFKVYDRQLRLWGLQAQSKMKESKVLIVNLTSVCTELARHLVLSGISLELLDVPERQVEEHDIESDFLFAAADLGLKRAEVVKSKLSDMNPFVKVEVDSKTTLCDLVEGSQQLSRPYSAIVYGIRTFSEATKLNEIARQSKDTAFYCLNSSGLQGFFFADVGKELAFTYQHQNDPQRGECQGTITDSRSLQDFLQIYLDTETKLSWSLRESRQSNKFLLLSIVSQYMKEQDSSMESQAQLWSKLCQLILQKGLNKRLTSNEEFKALFEQFDKCFNLQFNPSSSVIGSIVSQEIVKVITQKDHPGHGFFVYDSTTQRCVMEQI